MIKAFLLGLTGVGLICGFTYFNDNVLHQTILISNHMPVSVYGGLIIFLLVINPLLFRLGRRAGFTSRQLAVVLAMVLASCTVPGFGLMRTLTTSLMLPHYHNRIEPGWQEQNIIDLAPKRMLADPSKNESEALNGFIQGMGVGSKHISFSRIPWYAWTSTLVFWLPLVLFLWIGLIALSVLVHPQWSLYEQLPYPIVRFANALLPQHGKIKSHIFNNRLFWIGCGAILVIHLINYTYRWFPSFIEIPTTFDFRPLKDISPTFIKGGGLNLFMVSLEFTVIAFAYFLSSDVSLSLGIGPFLWAFVVGIFLNYGVSIVGAESYDFLTLRPMAFINFGAYFGFFLAIFYWGRNYYANVFKRAFLLPSREKIENQYVWSARIFIVSFFFFFMGLVFIGLNWELALLYTIIAVIIFIVMSRIVVETGLFFIQAWCFPGVILWGIFGAKALGPQTILIMSIVTTVILMDPRETLMPYMSNSLKLLELHKVKYGKVAMASVVAIIFALIISVPLTLYFQYDRGVNFSDHWTIKAAGFAFKNAVRIKHRLVAQGDLHFSDSFSGWESFIHMSPNKPCMIAFAAGFILVILFSFSRIKLAWWPLHPVMFLVWSTYPGRRFAASFFIGWFIRFLVTKYGGVKIYNKLKPLMFGLIAGDMLGGIIPILIGIMYYYITGDIPK